MEIWKPIAGYEGYYEVSNLGRIRSVEREITVAIKGKTFQRNLKGKFLKQVFDGRGMYLFVILAKHGKNRMALVHRLVATAFLDNPLNLPEVNHKDENKQNNAVSNLEWCTHKYNSHYGARKKKFMGEKNPRSKFSEEIIQEIRRTYKPRDPNFGNKALSKKYGISTSHISAIVHRNRWGWL